MRCATRGSSEKGRLLTNPLLQCGRPLVIGHRGAAAEAPENTLESFRLALEQGVDALELDVRLSADGQAVVIHDPTLDRTTDRRGPVRALTAAELRLVDAGHRFTGDRSTFPFRGKGIHVPTLSEVLEAFPEVPLLIEAKEAEAQEAIAAAITQAGAQDRCVVASALPEAVQAFRQEPFLSGASGPEISQLYFGSWTRRLPPAVPYRLLAVPWQHRGLPIAISRFMGAATRLGCPVHVWTVDSPFIARRLWAHGASGIITNVPRRIVPLKPKVPANS